MFHFLCVTLARRIDIFSNTPIIRPNPIITKPQNNNTSTFLKQAQEEVLMDGYPVKLISGIDLVNMFKHLNLITDNPIKNHWVKNILSGE